MRLPPDGDETWRSFWGLLDTGATNTCIDEQLCNDAGFPTNGSASIGSFSMDKRARTVAAAVMIEGFRSLIRVKVIAHRFENQTQYRSIIGADVLMRYDVEMFYLSKKYRLVQRH